MRLLPFLAAPTLLLLLVCGATGCAQCEDRTWESNEPPQPVKIDPKFARIARRKLLPPFAFQRPGEGGTVAADGGVGEAGPAGGS